jgi:hypothetical protein
MFWKRWLMFASTITSLGIVASSPAATVDFSAYKFVVDGGAYLFGGNPAAVANDACRGQLITALRHVGASVYDLDGPDSSPEKDKRPTVTISWGISSFWGTFLNAEKFAGFVFSSSSRKLRSDENTLLAHTFLRTILVVSTAKAATKPADLENETIRNFTNTDIANTDWLWFTTPDDDKEPASFSLVTSNILLDAKSVKDVGPFKYVFLTTPFIASEWFMLDENELAVDLRPSIRTLLADTAASCSNANYANEVQELKSLSAQGKTLVPVDNNAFHAARRKYLEGSIRTGASQKDDNVEELQFMNESDNSN